MPILLIRSTPSRMPMTRTAPTNTRTIAVIKNCPASPASKSSKKVAGLIASIFPDAATRKYRNTQPTITV